MRAFVRQPMSVMPTKAPQQLARLDSLGSRSNGVFADEHDLKADPPSPVGFDFRSIRIFPDSDSPTVTGAGVLAAALGDQIHLAPALSTISPESQRAVLAHEFAYVAQQHNEGGIAADEETLSRRQTSRAGIY